MLEISKSQNISHFLLNRELGSRPSSKNFRDKWLIQNIDKGNYKKNIFNNHREPVLGLDVSHYFVVTLFHDRIKLWNLEIGKCLWTLNLEPEIRGWGTIKIVEDRIVFTDSIKISAKIGIIDLAKGLQTATIYKLGIDLICVLGRSIFCSLTDGAIEELDLEGEFVRKIHFEILSDQPRKLLGLGNFLVRIADQTIMIYDLQEDKSTNIQLTIEEKETLSIDSADIEGDCLICGLSTLGKKAVYYVIDLERVKVIHQYQGILTLLDTETHGIIWTVTTNKEWIYLGCSTGKVVAVNLVEKKYVVLGEHKACVCHLATEGQILISGSCSTIDYPAELKFWDIQSMTKLKEMEFPSLYKISFFSGKLVAAIEGSLVQWNYLVSHKGEVSRANSAQVIEKLAAPSFRRLTWALESFLA